MVRIRLNVTVPDRPFAKKKWLDEIARTQRQTSVPRLKKLFQKSVYGWSKKPSFEWKQNRAAGTISIEMYAAGPNANIWELVSAGSPAHEIRPRKAKILRFRPGYRSATRPGQLMGRRAYRSGKFVGASKVSHPGFEGRNFPELIMQEYQNDFITEMQEAINEVARK